MKKLLISITIMLALPITANATGPAHDSGNSPVVATASAPYQTVTPDAHADEHIASTKYVIGAYNDAIAAVNNVAETVDGKQDLISVGGIDASSEAAVDSLVGAMFAAYESGSYSGYEIDDKLASAIGVAEGMLVVGNLIGNQLNDKQDKLTLVDTGDEISGSDDSNQVYGNAALSYDLFSNAQSNADLVQAANASDFNTRLITAGAVLGAMAAQRVDVYTTWENDSAKTQVAFSTAAVAQSNN